MSFCHLLLLSPWFIYTNKNKQTDFIKLLSELICVCVWQNNLFVCRGIFYIHLPKSEKERERERDSLFTSLKSFVFSSRVAQLLMNFTIKSCACPKTRGFLDAYCAPIEQRVCLFTVCSIIIITKVQLN